MAPPQQAAEPFLDLARFAARSHLAAVARSMAPCEPMPHWPGRLCEAVTARWACHLGVPEDALLLVSSADEASALLASALLLPDDVVVLALPSAARWPAATLTRGARFLDLQRLRSLELDPSAVTAAQRLHPGAVWIAEAPAWSGRDDVLSAVDGADQALIAPPDGARALLIDRSDAASLGGELLTVPGAGVAVVVALRDVARGGEALLAGIVAAPASVAALRAQAGPRACSLIALEAASVVLGRIGAAEQAPWHAMLEARAASARTAVAQWVGAESCERSSLYLSVRCDAGDGAALAATLRANGWAATAFAPHPMRGVVRINLLQSRPRIGEKPSSGARTP